MNSHETFAKIAEYIDYNPLAVLGTTNDNGTPYGAVVNICVDNAKHTVYFLTKTGTEKYKNLSARDHVSLTIVNAEDNSTLQATGKAFVVRDPLTLDMVTKRIARAHAFAKEWLPPIAKLHAGAYAIIGVDILHARLAEFKGAQIGDSSIFTVA